MGFQPIREYGIIGNDDRCALVDRHGSIDWCCFPHLAGPSVFARILDDDHGGHFAVRPTDTYDVQRRYLGKTNVLQTTFETRSGRATLTDFMPITERDHRDQSQHAIYRNLRCEEGRLPIELEYKPRLDYARAETTVERGERSIVATGDSEQLHLQVHGPLNVQTRDGRAVGTTTIEVGETIWFALQYEHFTPMPPTKCQRAFEATIDYWRTWAEEFAEAATAIVNDEPWKGILIRSGLALKLLINEGTGAIYAAATTSLPEEYGGERNWDYRYNWIRDAKFTVQALSNLGQEHEAHKYFEWFREISHEDPAEIQPVYGVHGETALDERVLDHLSGYRHSEPVRIGNEATEQRQLDIYGAIVQGLYEMLRHDERVSEEDWKSIRALVDHVCGVWDEPDAGIWEFRENPRHYVHSKLLCWVALDSGIELADGHNRDAPIDHWREERADLRESIEERGYSKSAGTFVQYFDADDALDATCLLIPIYEFLSPDDPRVESTIDTVLNRLMGNDGLVYRIRGSDVAPDEPSAFFFCTFWLIDALVLAGRVELAEEIFMNVLEYTTPLGLLSERANPRTGELLGNFPQAFSHIGLINSAVYLASARSDTDELEHNPQESTVDPQPLFRS